MKRNCRAGAEFGLINHADDTQGQTRISTSNEDTSPIKVRRMDHDSRRDELHLNSKRLIALLQYFLHLETIPSLALDQRAPQFICRCCGVLMKIVRTRISPTLPTRTRTFDGCFDH